MSVTMAVKQYIGRLAFAQPFATRELLPFGRRGTIDQILHLLVKNGHLVRLARGLFCKQAFSMDLPCTHEIALAKARAFGKTIVVHGIEALKLIKIRDHGCPETTYAVAGKSGSFQSIFGRIYFATTTHTRVQTGDSKAGIAIRALAQLGKGNCSEFDIYRAVTGFDRHDRIQLKKEFPPKMPGWMSDFVVHRYSKRKRQT